MSSGHVCGSTGLRARCLERKTLLEKPATLLRRHFLSTGKENERKRLGSPTVNEKDYQDEAGKDSLKSCLNQFRSSDERDASRKEKIEKLIDRVRGWLCRSPLPMESSLLQWIRRDAYCVTARTAGRPATRSEPATPRGIPAAGRRSPQGPHPPRPPKPKIHLACNSCC